MRTINLIGVFLITVSFTQCKSIQFEKNPPFKISSASYVVAVGGMPGSSSMQFDANFTGGKNITFNELFFLGRKTKITFAKNNTVLSGFFNTSTIRNKKDLQMHRDGTKEYGNEPLKTEKFPFELKENEAVISYTQENKLKYVKVTNIKKRQSIIMQ